MKPANQGTLPEYLDLYTYLFHVLCECQLQQTIHGLVFFSNTISSSSEKDVQQIKTEHLWKWIISLNDCRWVRNSKTMQNLWQVGMKPYETPDFTACFPWPPALLGDANLCKVPLEGLGIKDQCLAVAAPLQQDSRGSKSLFPGGSRKLIRQRHLSPSTHARGHSKLRTIALGSEAPTQVCSVLRIQTTELGEQMPLAHLKASLAKIMSEETSKEIFFQWLYEVDVYVTL